MTNYRAEKARYQGFHKVMASALLATTMLAAGAIVAPGAAYAQEARSYDIPSGPLAVALNRFGEAANVELIYDSALTNGASSPGLKGSFNPAEALSRLLAGTGVTFRQTGVRVFTLERAPQSADGSVTLGPVRVQGEGAGRGGGTVRQPADTRGTYTVPVTSSATKLDLAIKDTPQIVNVITRQRIEDQNLTQIADVMAQQPGITVNQTGVAGAGRTRYFSRGFPVTSVMLDGVLVPGAAGGDFDIWGALDTAIYDRVELVQGSTGLATGAGDPSGSVNFVRKRPTETFQAEAKLSYGSWERLRGEVDISGPLNKDGSIRGRFVGAYQQGDTWQDRVHGRMGTLYGIVEADVTDSLMLTGGLVWSDMHINDAGAWGVNAYGPDAMGKMVSALDYIDRSFNNATTWSFANLRFLNTFAKAEWRFNDNWRLNVNYMYSDLHSERLSGQILWPDVYGEDDGFGGGGSDFNASHINVDAQVHNLDVSVTGKFNLFGREQDIVAGVSGYWGRTHTPLYAGTPRSNVGMGEWNNGDIPMTVGDPELMPGVPNPYYDGLNFVLGHRLTRETQLAGYLGMRLRPIDRVQVVFGGRVNKWRRSVPQADYIDIMALFSSPSQLTYVPNPHDEYSFTVKGGIIPYAGILRSNIDWDNSGWILDPEGKPLPPIKGNTVEIGAKAALFDNRLNIQLSLYHMKQKNYPLSLDDVFEPGSVDETLCNTSNPLSLIPSTCAVPGKGIISKGIDFSISGRVAPGFNLTASYSYLKQTMDMTGVNSALEEYKSGAYCSVGDLQGRTDNRLSTNCPPHSVKIFATYDVTDQLTLGAGGVWKSATKRLHLRANTTLPGFEALDLPAYAVIDLMARYKITPKITLSVNANNVFDKRYFSGATGGDFYGGGNSFGAPRNVMVSAGFKF